MAHLPAQLLGHHPVHVQQTSRARAPKTRSDMRQELIQALQATGGNKSEAARRLGISRVTLWKRINKFGIQVDKHIRE